MNKASTFTKTIITISIAITMPIFIVNTIKAQTDTVKPIEPPFGLSWGENSTNVKKWVSENKFQSMEGKTKDQRVALEVEGPFPEAEFNRLRFYFKENQLNEVELQFNNTGEPNNKQQEVEAFTKALAIKDQIDQQMGKGKLIKNEKGEKTGTTWQFIEQIWTDEEHSIWLTVFNANNPNKGALSITSLHYRWETKIHPTGAVNEKPNPDPSPSPSPPKKNLKKILDKIKISP